MDVPRSSTLNRPLTQWQDAADDEGVPWRMLCPIGHSIMHDPVVASDGNTYDRPALKRVLADVFEPRSPVTGEALTHVYLPNAALQREIASFIAHNPHLDEPLEPAQTQALQMAIAQGVAPHVAKAALLNATVLPDPSADVLLARLLEDIGHRPAKPAPSLNGIVLAPALQGADAPMGRSRRAGRLGAAEMVRQPPSYGEAAATAPVAIPQTLSIHPNEVRRRYQMMPQTPTRTSPSQLGARLSATRIWSSPPGEGFASPTTRGVAVGSLAGAVNPLHGGEWTELTFDLFD